MPVPGRLELEECLSKEYAACVPVASSPRAAFYGFDLFVTFYAACFLPVVAPWRPVTVFGNTVCVAFSPLLLPLRVGGVFGKPAVALDPLCFMVVVVTVATVSRRGTQDAVPCPLARPRRPSSGTTCACPPTPPVTSSPRAAFYGLDLFVSYYAAVCGRRWLPWSLARWLPVFRPAAAVFFEFGLPVLLYTACDLVFALCVPFASCLPSSPPLPVLHRRWDG